MRICSRLDQTLARYVGRQLHRPPASERQAAMWRTSMPSAISEEQLGVAVEPALQLGDGDQLPPATADDANLGGDVLLPEVPRDAQRSAGLGDAEREARCRVRLHARQAADRTARAMDLPG